MSSTPDQSHSSDSDSGVSGAQPRTATPPTARGMRFALVGVLNTAIDFTVLFVLVHLGLPVFGANLISTSAGMVFSFLVNRSFTFGFNGTKSVLLQVVQFVAITLVGLWLIQPLVMGLVGVALGGSGLDASMRLLLGKAAATCVSLVWNFTLYQLVVFRGSKG